MCLGKVHPPNQLEKVNVNKMFVQNGRGTIFEPCTSHFNLKETVGYSGDLDVNIFLKTRDDDKPGLSMEDRTFIQIMDNEMVENSAGNWTAPLPFRSNQPRLPNNKAQAITRAIILERNLKKNPLKREHFITFMTSIFEKGYAEVAPPLKEKEECWYLPIFGVYHPKKPNQLRGVFDSSAQFDGISLNNVLMSGPDSTNSLLGILLRFRKEKVGLIADIEKMFYSFYVREDHRNYLRFLWYRNNYPSENMIEYRMCVHVFGNSPSPAVATYGLRKTVQNSQEDVKEFVCKNFYVDDAITSLATPEEAVSLMKRTQIALSKKNIKLHKIASNSKEVMNAFPVEDLAKEFKTVDISKDFLPLQRTLGITWDLDSDTFTFRIAQEEKPYTRRGVLSTVNSIYDPLGFIAPIIIRGKLLFRELVEENTDWDKELSGINKEKWDEWKNSLYLLEQIRIPRTYIATSLSSAKEIEVHIFSDASEQAIAAVAYIRVKLLSDESQTGFVLGKSKVAPRHGHTVPSM